MMTTKNKGKVCPQTAPLPPIRLAELQGLSPAELAAARATLQRGEPLHIVDPVTQQSRRVVA